MLSIFIHSSMIIFLDRQQIFSLVYECREFPHCFLYAHHQIMFWLIVHQAKFSQAKVSAYTKNIWADISCAPTCQKSRWLLLIKKTSQAFPTSIPDCTPPIPLLVLSLRGFPRDVNNDDFESYFLRPFCFQKFFNYILLWSIIITDIWRYMIRINTYSLYYLSVVIDNVFSVKSYFVFNIISSIVW